MRNLQYVLCTSLFFLNSCSALLKVAGIGDDSDPFQATASGLTTSMGDGAATGWYDASGQLARESFQVESNIQDAVIECRSGELNKLTAVTFSASACDFAKMAQGQVDVAIRPPTLRGGISASGFFAAEVRIKDAAGVVLSQATHQRYIHSSLSRIRACSNKNSDAQILAYARQFITKNGNFGASTQIANPFISLEWADRSLTSANSLRRIFRLTKDKDFVLIRRSLASKKSGGASCDPGVAIAGFEGAGYSYTTPVSRKPALKHNRFRVECDAVVANAAGDGVCVAESSAGSLSAPKIFTAGAMKRRLRARATHSPWSPKIGHNAPHLSAGANHLATVLSD